MTNNPTLPIVEKHLALLEGITPGPWRVDDRRHKAGALQVQAQHRGVGSSYCVATVNYWEAPEANARLIAAAPEAIAEAAKQLMALYEALTEARNTIEGLQGQFDHQGCTCTFPDNDCCAFARADSAIVKAGTTLAIVRGEAK